jgi:hypothetical protein
VRARRKPAKVKTLKANSVAPDRARQIKGGPNGQPWRSRSIARALEKGGE